MTTQQVSNKKGKSLAENLMIIVMLGVLMVVFISYFFKQEEHLTKAGFDSVANTFSARVTGIRAQWFMDNQPRWVVIKEIEIVNGKSTNIRIPVNSSGWIDVEDSVNESNINHCQLIWQQVLATPMVYMKQPISAVLVKVQPKQIGKKANRLCQYGLPSGEYFEYQPSSGRVSQLKQY